MRHQCINPAHTNPCAYGPVSPLYRIYCTVSISPELQFRLSQARSASLLDVAIHVMAQASRAPTANSHMPWYQPTNTIRGYEGTVSISSRDQVLDIIYIMIQRLDQ